MPHALTDNWERFAHLDWQPSQLSAYMQQTMIPIDDDISLCVEAGGNPKNPALLLIMGLGSQMTFWSNEFIERLIKAGFFVIRFDNRDIGLSSKVQNKNTEMVKHVPMMLRLQVGISNRHIKTPYLLTDMAEDTAKLIQALKLERVYVLGASMGGMIAQILAARHAHLVSRLGLLFTSNNRRFLPTPYPKQLQAFFKKPNGNSENDIIEHSLWFVQTIGSPGYIDTQKISAMAQQRFQRSYYPLGVIHQLQAILATGSIAHFSSQINIPTLVLHGSRDGFVPPAHGRAVANHIQDAKFVLIEGMGHDIPDYYQPFIVQQLQQHFQS